MTLPALEKTWEFRTNYAFTAPGGTYDVHRQLAYYIKNLLTDTIANGYQDASFVNIGGDTWAIQGISDDVVDVSMVGKTVKIRGSTTVGNNGDYTITAVPSATEIQYTNVNGFAEAVNGSWSVIGGNFTNPWVIQHSQDTSGVPGTKDDGVDQIGTYTDWIDHPTAFPYVVIRNPVTETEWYLSGENNTTSGGQYDGYAVTRSTTYPNYFEPGAGGADSRANGNTVINVTGSRTAHRQWTSDNQYWFTGNVGAGVVKLHLAMSSDGEHTRLLGCMEGYIALFYFDETVKNPHPDWISGGNATVTSMTASGALSNRPTYGTYNDAATAIGSTIPPTGYTSGLSHHAPDLYLSAEGYGSAAVGQNVSVANELTGEYGLYPIGVVCTELGHRARIGQLKDMWWCPTTLTAANTLPDNTSRQFLVLEDMVIPWDGSIPEIS